ncbi:MAG: hypothetical protein V7K32_22020 [Nostoc sp.]
MKTYTRQKLTFEQFLEQCLEEGTLFRGSKRIVSRTFPELALTAEQILTV